MVNPKLLRGIPIESREFCKLVLFAIEESIDFKHLSKDEIYTALTLLSEDKGNKAVQLVYHQNRKYQLAHPLFVKEEDIVDELIESIRNVFDKSITGKPGLKSDKITVGVAISEWRKRNPDATVDEIVSAATLYIADCRINDRIIRSVNRFIITDSDCLLETWLEEVSTHTEDNWRNKVG